MARSTLARLRPKEHAALLQFRDATEGGDPNMGAVSLSTVQALRERGFIRRHTAEEATYLLRHHVVTPEGAAWLDRMTHGPACEPWDPCGPSPIHTKDSDCTVGPDGCCAACGVAHGFLPSLCCGGRGFHRKTCLEVNA
jgi:hypothetical protein